MTSVISTSRLLLALVVWIALVLAADANDAPVADRILEQWQPVWTAGLWAFVAIVAYFAIFAILREGAWSPRLWRVVLRLWLPLASGLSLSVVLARAWNVLPDIALLPLILCLTAPLPMLRGDSPRIGAAAGLLMTVAGACAWRWSQAAPILTLSLCVVLVLLSVADRQQQDKQPAKY